MFARLTKSLAGGGSGHESRSAGGRGQHSNAQNEMQMATAAETAALAEAVADALPPQYYDDKYDGARAVLADIPISNAELHVFLERTQAKQQKLLDAVSGKLSKEVMKNYESFIAGMRQISEIDMDISRAGIHVSNSLRKLGTAKEVLILGTLGIAYRRRKRERLAMVKSQLSWLRSLHQLEGTINTACSSHRYAEAVGFIVDAQNKVRDPTASVSSIHVLAALKPKVEGGLESLRGRVDRALEALLVSFESSHYGSALLGYRELDQYGVRSTAAAHATHAASNALSGGMGTGAGAAGRGRAGTAAFDDALGADDFPASTQHHQPGASLLAEASSHTSMMLLPGGSGAAAGAGGGAGGSSIAAAASASMAANQSLVDALPSLSSAESNLASLPAAIQAAATRAVKSLTKDAVIDHLLQDTRKRVEEEEKAAREKARAARLMIDETADQGGAGAAEGEEGKSTKAAASKMTAAEEYAVRRRDLKQRPFSELCASIPADEIPQACVAVAAACVHVMHSHYLLLQWHRLPFDPRSNGNSNSGATGDGAGSSTSSEECGFLHRNGPDDEDDEAAAEVLAAGSSASKTYRQAAKQAASRPAGTPPSGSRPSPLAEPAAFIELLRHLRPFLLRGRHAVWQHMQQRFATLLLSAVGTAGVNLPLERLAQALIVSRDLMAVGVEYVGHGAALAMASAPTLSSAASAAAGGSGGSSTGAAALASVVDSDPCNTLRSSLRLLCGQYMDSVHGDTFDRLKGMLAKESWQPIPAFSEQAMVGVMQSAIGGASAGSGSNGSGSTSGAGAVPLSSGSSSSTSLFKRFNSSKAAYLAISAAIKGEDLAAVLQAAGVTTTTTAPTSATATGSTPGTPVTPSSAVVPSTSSSKAIGAAIAAFQRTYSDGASVFACWVDRGNPFGFVKISISGANPSASGGASGGLTVLATPRLELVSGNDDDDEDDEDEDDDDDDDDDDEDAPADEETKKKRAAAKAKKAALASERRLAAQQRRASARHMRRVHGDTYLLEIGLGRGPTLGFSSLLVNPHTTDSDAAAANALAISGGGSSALSKKRLGAEAAGHDDDDEGDDEDDDDEGFIEHSGDTSSEDEETDDDSADGFSDDDEDGEHSDSGAAGRGAAGRKGKGARRTKVGGKRRRGRMGDGSSHISVGASVAEVIQASFGSASASGGSGVGAGGQHVVTTAALSGFARAVGRYLMLMEVLPTVGMDAFTGLCRLFELYLYTVATVFTRGPALRQLFNVAPPQPLAQENEYNPNLFDYLDASTLALVTRVAALACEGRALANKQAGYASASSLSSSSGRNRTIGGASAGAISSSAARGASGVGFSSGASIIAGGGNSSVASEFESVTLYGASVFVRGLPAMAQAQGLSSDHYTAAGAGAAQGQVLGGDAYNNEGVFVLLRRALQLIGAELHGLTGRGGGGGMGMAARSGSSVLAEAPLNQDNPSSFPARGFSPDFFVRPSASLDLDEAATGYGVCERSVAVESLDFLLDVLQRIRPRIETHLPPAAMPRVNAFYSRSVLVVSQLRAVLYNALVPKLLPEAGALPGWMTAVKWDAIREAMEPNPYVAQLSQNLVAAAAQLNSRVKAGNLPPTSRLSLWGCIVSHLMEKFADGVSRVRKCTVPGRGLMSLDVGHIYSVAMKQVPLPPQVLPRDKAYADSYVSAYYFDSETDVLQWVAKNRGAYPLRMARAIVLNGIGAALKKKQLKDVVHAIEGMYLLAPVTAAGDDDGPGSFAGLGMGMGMNMSMGMGMGGFTGGSGGGSASEGTGSGGGGGGSKRTGGLGMNLGMGNMASLTSNLASGFSSMASSMSGGGSHQGSGSNR